MRAIVLFLAYSTVFAQTAQTIRVSSSQNLQQALDNAKPGDTLVLDAGATWTGNYVLAPKPGATPITITSSRASELPVGQRASQSNTPMMARLVSPNTKPVITAAPGSHDWRLVGLEMASAPGIYNAGLVLLGDGAAPSIDYIPARLEVDRCYIHGDSRVGGRRGIAVNARNTVIQNSYVSDWKASGEEAQAISCWQCSDIRLENNYLESSADTITFSASSNLPIWPANIIIRRNHVRKPLSWRSTSGGLDPNGAAWSVKALIDLSSGVNVTIERNVLENTWLSNRGPGTVLNIRAQRSTGTNVPRTENLVLQDNLAIGGCIGVSITGTDASGGKVKDVTIRRNAFVDMGKKWGAEAILFRISGGPAQNVILESNSFLGSGVNAAMTLSGLPSTARVVNNLFVHGAYGAKGDGLGTGKSSLNAYFLQPLLFTNVFIGSSDQSALYPPGNPFVPAIAFAADGFSQTQVQAGVSGGLLQAAIAGVPSWPLPSIAPLTFDVPPTSTTSSNTTSTSSTNTPVVRSASTTPQVLRVRADQDLQLFLDAAQPGDTIVLDAGASWTGNFTFRGKSGIAPVILTSSRAAELPEGKRATPANAPLMARLMSPNNLAVITATDGSHDLRLIGLELTTATGIYSTGLVRLGSGETPSIDQIPARIEVDRCYIHADRSVGGRRGIALNAKSVVIRNSYISEWKAIGEDSQAIACWQCSDVRIENNFLEGSGENVMFSSNSNLPIIPTGIVVRGNHLFKPLSWMTGADKHPTGALWQVKNLFELKSGIDVLVERNILENSWVMGQTGYIFNIKAQRNSGVNTPRTENVVIQDNLAIGGCIGVSILGYDAESGGITWNVTIRRNAFIDLGKKWGADGNLLRVIGGPTNDVVVENNTMVGEGINSTLTASGLPSLGLRVTNNLFVHGAYGVKGQDKATGNNSLLAYFTSPLFTNNVFIGSDQSKLYPASNVFVPKVQFAADGFTQSEVFAGVNAVQLLNAIAGVR